MAAILYRNQDTLDVVVATILANEPLQKTTFLSALGKSFHASSLRALFTTVIVPDSDRHFDTTSSIAYPILTGPAHLYADLVKTLVVVSPEFLGAITEGSMAGVDDEDLTRLLGTCHNLEEFIWKSALPPPDGICETLSRLCPHLTRFERRADASHVSVHRNGYTKWNAPSLPRLNNALTHITMTRMSQAGSRLLFDYLVRLGENSMLESAELDFVWLEDSLCEALVGAGRRLSNIHLSTSGTKLTDRGIVALIEGCDALKTFAMDDVEGRLSKTLWTKPETFPPGLRNISFTLSEYSGHHSWSTDHLSSLSSIPLETLHSLSVVTRKALPSTNSEGHLAYPTDSAISLHSIHSDMVKALESAKSLRILRCDLWSLSLVNVKNILEHSPRLEKLQLCLDAPFSKLLGLTSSFSFCTQLRELSITILPEQCPGDAPNLRQYSQQEAELATPTGVDSSMPSLRDIKRFVKKCPNMGKIDWYGRHGRGSWTMSRGLPTLKLGTNVVIEYQPPYIAMEVQEEIQKQAVLESELGRTWLNSGRKDNEWMKEGSFASGQNESEASPPPRSKSTPKKHRTPSIISASGSSETSDGGSPETPTGSPHSSVAIISPMPSPDVETRPNFPRVRLPSDHSMEYTGGESKFKSRIRRRSTANNDKNESSKVPRARGRGAGRRASISTTKSSKITTD